METVGTFYKKELQKANKREFRVEKVIKRKSDKLYVKWKDLENCFNSCIDKKDIVTYFSEPYTRSKSKMKLELDLSNYAIKSELKNTTGVDTSALAKTIDLASLKEDFDELDIDKLKNVPSGLSNLSKVDKLDLDQLVPVPVGFNKLSDVVKNDVVKMTESDEFIKKNNDIKTTDTSGLVKKADYGMKIHEIEKRIIDHDHDLITTQELNKLMPDDFAARLIQANLGNKNDIDDLVKR